MALASLLTRHYSLLRALLDRGSPLQPAHLEEAMELRRNTEAFLKMMTADEMFNPPRCVEPEPGWGEGPNPVKADAKPPGAVIAACPVCDGSGDVPSKFIGRKRRECEVCSGSGRVPLVEV
jgi:hypothetical protein